MKVLFNKYITRKNTYILIQQLYIGRLNCSLGDSYSYKDNFDGKSMIFFILGGMKYAS